MARKVTVSKDEATLKNRLYGQAQAELRKRHVGEFADILGDLYADHGLTYKRPLTERDKARALVVEALAKYPDLVDLIPARVTEE